MTTTVTIRPGARTTVTRLPWTGSGSDGYALIEDCIGATRRGQVTYDRSRRAFSVARTHTVTLINALASRLGRVTVVQYGGTEKCVEACWNARPRTAITCECSCAGGNHGTGVPLGRIVSETGPAGALSVGSTGPRTYVVRG